VLGNVGAFNSSQGKAGGVANSSQLSLVAGEALGYPRALMLVLGKAYLFQPATAVFNSFLGINTQSVNSGVTVPVVTTGKITYIGWGLTPNALQYANANGIISNIPIAGVGNMQPIGIALDADTLLLKDLNSIEVI